MWPLAGGRHFGSLAWRPGPTEQPVSSTAWMPQTKQPTGQEHNPTHHETGYLKTSWANSHLYTCPLTPPYPLEGQDPTPPINGQAPAPLAREPAQASRPSSPTKGQKPKGRKLRSCSLWNWVYKCRSETTLGPAGPWSLGDERGVYCWSTLDITYRRPLLQGWEM